MKYKKKSKKRTEQTSLVIKNHGRRTACPATFGAVRERVRELMGRMGTREAERKYPAGK
jgi:hypothetical protein